MTERLLIALALGAGFVVAIALARMWMRRRDRRVLERLRAAPVPAGHLADNAPRLLYFTTETCVVCRVQQEPAIAALREHVTDLRVERHDAVADRELADTYGVLSVPTTAVFNRAGELVEINRGFAPAAVLFAQLEGREPSLDGGLPALSEPIRS